MHADVVAGFFQVGGGGLQVEGGQLYAAGSGQSVEQVHAGTQVEAGAGGIAALVGVVAAQAAAEAPVLAGRCVHGRKPGHVGGVFLNLPAFYAGCLCGYGEIVLKGPLRALLEGPGVVEAGLLLRRLQEGKGYE